jgi:hypothetical protein
MNRMSSFVILVTVATTMVSATLSAADEPAAKPNIVLIFADDKYSPSS